MLTALRVTRTFNSACPSLSHYWDTNLLTRRSLLTCFCSSVFLVLVTQLSLQEFALDCRLFKALSEEIVGGVATTMPTITTDRHNHSLVNLVVTKNTLETVWKVKELLVLTYLGLKYNRFYVLTRGRSSWNTTLVLSNSVHRLGVLINKLRSSTLSTHCLQMRLFSFIKQILPIKINC